MTLKFFILAALVMSNSALAGGDNDREEQIDSLFSAYQGDRPGAAVAVFKNSRIVFEKGYGLRQLDPSSEVSPSSNFRLASVSKAFTALAILQLVDRGLLSLNSTLKDVFKNFPNYGSRIKVRQLLNHTSGLYDYENLMDRYPTPRPIKDPDILQLIIDHTRSTYFTPGSQYRYSNTGYVLLAQIVEHVSGKRFSTFLDDEIFEPLGMAETVAYENGLNEVSERAFGYQLTGGRYQDADQSDTSSTLGDGGIYTSVREMFLWDQVWYHNTLISEELRELAMTPGRLNNGNQTSYGFGWSLASYRGSRAVTHTGSTTGFRTAFQRYPERNLSVVVLVNRANSSPWDIARNIADLYWDD